MVAYKFAKTYKSDVEAFMKFMCQSEFSVTGDFKESWKYIEEGMRSIERHTNLPICLEDAFKTKSCPVIAQNEIKKY